VLFYVGEKRGLSLKEEHKFRVKMAAFWAVSPCSLVEI
jgi:hypothetical protein